MRLLKRILSFMTCVALVAGTISLLPLQSEATNRSGNTYTSKKGLQVDIGTMSDVEDLGISEAFINVVFERFLCLGDTGVYCSANGSTYFINPSELEILDSAVRDLTNMGANVTIAFINQYVEGYEWLLYTGQPHANTADYGFNIQSDLGRNAISAVSSFIASRYNGGANGTVSRYVIGNEVNDNEAYNWVGGMDIDSYVNVYYETFKLFYDGIKSGKADAYVYVPLEHMWSTNNTNTSYAGKDFLVKFNNLAKPNNVDWNLAFHGYSEPLCNPNPLRDNSPMNNEKGELVPGGLVTDSENTTVITMRNLNVLTNFMNKDEMKNNAGQVRSIILSEQGFTSNSAVAGNSETLQAAAVSYAYYVAEMNPDIDAFIYYSYIEPTLDNDVNRFGIRNHVGNTAAPSTPKSVYYVYKYLDTDKSLDVTNFALSTLGIESWGNVIRNFDGSKFSSMKTVNNGQFLSVGSMDAANGKSVLSAGMATAQINAQHTEWILSNVYWNPGYYIHNLAAVGYNGLFNDTCVANVDDGVYAASAQTVYHEFTEPLNLTSTPYIGFTIGFDPKNSADAADVLNVRMRLYSGSNTYDVNTNVTSGNYLVDGTAYTLFADVSGWAYKNSIDKVAIWISESTKSTSYAGTFMIKDFSVATSLTSPETRAIGKDTSVKLLTAYPYMEQPWALKWGSKDVSGEFNWEQYYNDNPSLQASLGRSPVLLLADYAAKNIPVTEYVDMHRLYNPNNGEHFYTSNLNEKDSLIRVGWTYEGVAWKAPVHSNKPVYRLYNVISGEHHYTTNWNEAYFLFTTASGNDTGEDIAKSGWDYEGIGWFSDDLEFTPLYRLYNPNAKGALEPGSHHYTKDAHERDVLVGMGWTEEGIGWYGGKE